MWFTFAVCAATLLQRARSFKAGQADIVVAAGMHPRDAKARISAVEHIAVRMQVM
jgi:hypothetical protein